MTASSIPEWLRLISIGGTRRRRDVSEIGFCDIEQQSHDSESKVRNSSVAPTGLISSMHLPFCRSMMSEFFSEQSIPIST